MLKVVSIALWSDPCSIPYTPHLINVVASSLDANIRSIVNSYLFLAYVLVLIGRRL